MNGQPRACAISPPTQRMTKVPNAAPGEERWKTLVKIAEQPAWRLRVAKDTRGTAGGRGSSSRSQLCPGEWREVAPVCPRNTKVTLSPRSQQDPLKSAKQASKRSVREITRRGETLGGREAEDREDQPGAGAGGGGGGYSGQHRGGGSGAHLQGTATWDLGLEGWGDPQSVLPSHLRAPAGG